MPRLHQWLAGYLALCLGFGGFVGWSPVLHHWLEHGGHGPLHTHLVSLPTPGNVRPGGARGHGHSDGGWAADTAPAERFHPPLLHAGDSFAHPLDTLRIAALRILLLLGGEGVAGGAPSDPGAGHQHHSLFQALASGAVDAPGAPPVFLPVLPVETAGPLPRFLAPCGHRFDPAVAGRAPPLA